MRTNSATPFASLLLAIWMVIMCVAVAFAGVSKSEEISPVYDVMVEAAEIAQEAMDEIKAEKLRRGIALNENDLLETGMLGDYYTSITTTPGVLEAKRTSINANWAAVVVEMFRRANLREGDQIAMVFSGSFPALNICVLAAAQAYGLKQCAMASVGASYYGANNEEFTFFDMAEHLYNKGILTHRLDYVSLGGADDAGMDFYDETVKNNIINRIKDSGVTFIYQSDFVKNIDKRIEYIDKAVPDIKFMVNVGGSLVALGTGLTSLLETGYITPTLKNSGNMISWGKRDDRCGLLQYYLAQGIPVASFLNIKRLALIYGVPYDPDEKPQIGVGKMYYSEQYNVTVPIIALVLSAGIGVFYFFMRKNGKHSAEGREYEKNYILHRR